VRARRASNGKDRPRGTCPPQGPCQSDIQTPFRVRNPLSFGLSTKGHTLKAMDSTQAGCRETMSRHSWAQERALPWYDCVAAMKTNTAARTYQMRVDKQGSNDLRNGPSSALAFLERTCRGHLPPMPGTDPWRRGIQPLAKLPHATKAPRPRRLRAKPAARPWNPYPHREMGLTRPPHLGACHCCPDQR